VGGSIEAFRDEESIVRLLGGDITLLNGDELFFDFSNKVKSNLDLLHGVSSFNSCADDSDVEVLFADAMN
jgi:hypothetical protein